MTLDPARLREWLAIPAEELPIRSIIPFTLTKSREELHAAFANEVFDLISSARADNRPLSLIMPVGPIGQYRILARLINESQLQLNHVTFFGMDEWLDWQARPLPLEHPFSLEGTFQREFLLKLELGLRPRAKDVIFPSSLALDRPAEEIARRGGVDAVFGGVGFQGHVAFNEPPSSRWTRITLDELRGSRTRVLPLATDTIIAHAQRRSGGNVFAVPPMAATLGMRELLAARQARLYVDTGAWKQTMLRILLFSEPDVDYPATLFQDHPDARVTADIVTASVPVDALAVP